MLARIDGFLQDPAGLKTLSQLVDKLRTPRHCLLPLFELIGGIRACHLGAIPTGADNDLESFGESVFLAKHPGCSKSAKRTGTQIRRKSAL
jgi:hypothetical protein